MTAVARDAKTVISRARCKITYLHEGNMWKTTILMGTGCLLLCWTRWRVARATISTHHHAWTSPRTRSVLLCISGQRAGQRQPALPALIDSLYDIGVYVGQHSPARDPPPYTTKSP